MDTAPGSAPLEGTQWIVTSLHGRPLIEGTRITIAFADSTAGGYAGCNWYGTRYSVSGSTIRFEMAESTARACMVPPGVGEQEAAYLAALRRVVTHRVAGDRLELLDRDESAIISMTPRVRAAMDPAPRFRPAGPGPVSTGASEWVRFGSGSVVGRLTPARSRRLPTVETPTYRERVRCRPLPFADCSL